MEIIEWLLSYYNRRRKFSVTEKEKQLEELRNKALLEKTKNNLIIISLLALLIITVLLSSLFRSRAKQKEEEKKRIQVELENSKIMIEKDKEELKSFTVALMQKNKSIKNLNTQLLEKEHELSSLKNSKREELKLLSDLKILTEDDWRKYKLLFEKVYPQFFTQLNSFSVKFTKGEKRLMSLIKLNMENGEIADTLGISAESVSKSKFRLKKKLEKELNSSSVEEFMHKI